VASARTCDERKASGRTEIIARRADLGARLLEVRVRNRGAKHLQSEQKQQQPRICERPRGLMPMR